MFRSALLKLTAAYLAIVMFISSMFSVVLYHFATSELSSGLQNQYHRWFSEYQPFGLRVPASPGTELAARSHHILVELIYFNLLVLVVIGAASYLLARRSLRPIEAAHEQQKRFTADVSHELRTPLTALKMETEVALLDKKAPAALLRDVLTSNLEEVERMEGLINELLQLSSLEASEVRSSFAPVQLQTVAEAALGSIQKLADSKRIQIDNIGGQAMTVGDRAALIQLVVILLENAIKYSPVGSSVSLGVQMAGGRALVDIKDRGRGIDRGALPHIFDRFYRADPARSPQEVQGFGLGLSLAKLIADLHGGEITLTSTAGHGTTATVSLPLAAPEQSDIRATRSLRAGRHRAKS